MSPDSIGLEETWRWFGPKDPITLPFIRQTGASGIVTALHEIPIGEVWSLEDIQERKQTIEKHGLKWSVVESLPIHEDIKTHNGSFREYIENYKISIQNLAGADVRTICYNVMPVLDWTRTQLDHLVQDGSGALRFDWASLCAFDLFILERKHAEQDYGKEVITIAKGWFQKSTLQEKEALIQTMLAGLPGSDQGFNLDHFKNALARYQQIDPSTYLEHLKYFLDQVVPVAEENNVKLCVHPDDPPFNILGLPRVIRNGAQVGQYLDLYPSSNHGFTLCTGSLGADPENNVVSITEEHKDRIHFVHLRNVTSYDFQSFYEDNHLEGSVDMAGVVRILLDLAEERKILLPFRPDHGHTLAKECEPSSYPGYPLIGRMRGLAELRGLILGLKSQKNLK